MKILVIKLGALGDFVLAMAAMKDDACPEDDRRKESAGSDPLHRADPAALRREHEEQRDPERRNRTAGDCEPSRSEDIEAGEQCAEGESRERPAR